MSGRQGVAESGRTGHLEDGTIRSSFQRALLDHDPFLDDRFEAGASPSVEVSEIHKDALEALIDWSRRVVRGPRSVGVCVLGGSGVGKSHLIGRLVVWANSPDEHRRPKGWAVHLLPSPGDSEAWPDRLIRQTLDQLTVGNRDEAHRTPLFRLVGGAIWASVWSRDPEAHQLPLDRARAWFAEDYLRDDAGHCGPQLSALFDYFAEAYRKKEGFKATIETVLPTRSSDDRLGPDDALAWFVSLSRLAWASRRPLIVAVDGLEQLDEPEIAGLLRSLALLLDRSPNTLVVWTIEADYLQRIQKRGLIGRAVWDRLERERIALSGPSGVETLQMVLARLEALWSALPREAMVALARRRNPLFPLPADWLDSWYAEDQIDTLRKALGHAHRGWLEAREELSRRGPLALLADQLSDKRSGRSRNDSSRSHPSPSKTASRTIIPTIVEAKRVPGPTPTPMLVDQPPPQGPQLPIFDEDSTTSTESGLDPDACESLRLRSEQTEPCGPTKLIDSIAPELGWPPRIETDDPILLAVRDLLRDGVRALREGERSSIRSVESSEITDLIEPTVRLLEALRSEGLAESLLDVRRLPSGPDVSPPYDLQIRSGSTTPGRILGVRFQSLTGIQAMMALQSLLEETSPEDQRILVTDPDWASKLDPRGASLLADLHNLGVERFRHLELDPGRTQQIHLVEEHLQGPELLLDGHRLDNKAWLEACCGLGLDRDHPLLRALIWPDDDPPIKPSAPA